jgi:hypothetical protein
MQNIEALARKQTPDNRKKAQEYQTLPAPASIAQSDVPFWVAPHRPSSFTLGLCDNSDADTARKIGTDDCFGVRLHPTDDRWVSFSKDEDGCHELANRFNFLKMVARFPG